MNRRGKTAKPPLPLSDLAAQTSLSIPEAMRLTGYGRQLLEQKLDNGDILWYEEGARRRVITRSILDYQDRRAKECMGVAS